VQITPALSQSEPVGSWLQYLDMIGCRISAFCGCLCSTTEEKLSVNRWTETSYIDMLAGRAALMHVLRLMAALIAALESFLTRMLIRAST